MIEEKKVTDSMVEMVRIVMPNHLNGAGRLFGGILMKWLDEAASLVAIRHARGRVATVSVDNLRFIQGANLSDIIVMAGKITFVGNTSMEVRVDTYVENMDGHRQPINKAYFTIVSMSESGELVKAPRIILETEEERAEWKAGEKRRKMRVKREREGF